MWKSGEGEAMGGEKKPYWHIDMWFRLNLGRIIANAIIKYCFIFHVFHCVFCCCRWWCCLCCHVLSFNWFQQICCEWMNAREKSKSRKKERTKTDQNQHNIVYTANHTHIHKPTFYVLHYIKTAINCATLYWFAM